jgi:hypothetical protein
MSAFYSSVSERQAGQAARKIARRRAAELNVTIEVREDGSWFELLLQAPTGYIFAKSDLHEHVIANAGTVSDGLWKCAADTLAEEEVIKCSEHCEWCHPCQ